MLDPTRTARTASLRTRGATGTRRHGFLSRFFLAAAFAIEACVPSACGPTPEERRNARVVLPEPDVVTISVVGTNDLHGHLEALPAFSGYVAALRAARRADGGGVVLLDGGDMFQGTLESNLAEGAPVVEAYAALGYDAVTIGNHEFDYGPVGERATPASADDDPRGALRARAAQAPYPFLSANLFDAATRERATLGTNERPVLASATIEVAGVTVGIVGVTTEDTLTTTIAANVAGLVVMPLARTIAAHAQRLRDEGAHLVLVAAHAGGECRAFDDPRDLSSCDADEEIMAVAHALPAGSVDAIVAGHTHQAMAHVVAGIPIIESYAYGRAFGRVDLVVDRTSGRVIERRLFPPMAMCRGSECETARYEGLPIEPDPRVTAIVELATARAATLRARPLGVTLTAAIRRAGGRESALGNLFTDLMRAARPDADVAVYNGGGLRADLPAGPLTYGAFYEALPFDNRFATVRTTAGELARLFARNASRSGSFLSVSGVRVEVRCDEGGALRVRLSREDGRILHDDEPLTLVTSDFLATGGDGIFGDARARGAVSIDDGPPMREAMVDALSRRGGEISPAELFARDRRRVELPSERPVRCE